MLKNDDPPAVARAPRWRPDLRWFAAEITVVVVGILIALALNSWWIARQDAARATSYLVRIREDLLADADALDKRLDYFAKVQQYADDAIAHSEAGTLRNGSPWATVVAYYHASQIWPYVSNSRTYDEMQNAGDLRLIPRPDLRAALGSYYDESEVSQGAWIFGTIPDYRGHIRGLTPLPVQRYLFASCSEQDSYEDQVLLDCASPVPENEAAAVLAGYRSAPGVVEELRDWGSTLVVSDIIMRMTREAARKLADRVGAAAGA